MDLDKHGDGILVQAPTLGLGSLYFSGESVKVEIESWMRGKMCGMCGKADGEKKTEFRMPSWNTAMNPSSFVHSWILQGEVCSDVCKLQHQTVKLEKHVSLMGRESNCYTVEPVLRCRPGCSASDTVHISVRFHCVPLDHNLSQTEIVTKSEQMEGMTEAHIACICSGTECSEA
ncbi:vitellogenin-like [Lepisosteus oculatus]|uniref:vitellogenin-like n=1 Tax=Lepisosteus oculatus TaxID=7918 RepID=UPI003718190D